MKNKHFFIVAILFSALLISVGNSCKKSDDSNNNNSATTKTINIVGMAYSPASLTVTKGTIVKWVNTDSAPHTATSNDGSTFDSGNMNSGATYSYTTATTGTFEYHCTIHGLTMAGTLIVTQ